MWDEWMDKWPLITGCCEHHDRLQYLKVAYAYEREGNKDETYKYYKLAAEVDYTK